MPNADLCDPPYDTCLKPKSGSSKYDQVSLKDTSVLLRVLSVVMDLGAQAYIFFCIHVQKMVQSVGRRDRRLLGPYQRGGCADFQYLE